MNLNKLHTKTLEWSKDRGILDNGKLSTQALKLVSEVGELCDNLAKDNIDAMKDDIGDCLVLLTNIANLAGTDLEECWNVAYNDIKDRKGFLNANGNFIKSIDENYEELLAAHIKEQKGDPKVTAAGLDWVHESFGKLLRLMLKLEDDSAVVIKAKLLHQGIPNNFDHLLVGHTTNEVLNFLLDFAEVVEFKDD